MTIETIEIKGVKFEVDMSTAKKIHNFKVGDKIRVLVKKYSNDYSSYFGMVVGFDWFEKMPNIRICYLEIDYSTVRVKFIDYNGESKDIEISPLNEIAAIALQENDVIRKFDEEISKHQDDISHIKKHKQLVQKHFGQLLTPTV